jgi:hypothetical protein
MTVYRTQTFGERRRQIEQHIAWLEKVVARFPFRGAELADARADLIALTANMKAHGRRPTNAYRPHSSPCPASLAQGSDEE